MHCTRFYAILYIRRFLIFPVFLLLSSGTAQPIKQQTSQLFLARWVVPNKHVNYGNSEVRFGLGYKVPSTCSEKKTSDKIYSICYTVCDPFKSLTFPCDGIRRSFFKTFSRFSSVIMYTCMMNMVINYICMHIHICIRAIKHLGPIFHSKLISR